MKGEKNFFCIFLKKVKPFQSVYSLMIDEQRKWQNVLYWGGQNETGAISSGGKSRG